ncbi:MAG: hypothetical protein LBT98_03845 [Puniceicoccales bacterium]|jgi:hypothetical protein|nr:hypothetical protein [Puniceicoccales bacterium]
MSVTIDRDRASRGATQSDAYLKKGQDLPAKSLGNQPLVTPSGEQARGTTPSELQRSTGPYDIAGSAIILAETKKRTTGSTENLASAAHTPPVPLPSQTHAAGTFAEKGISAKDVVE